MYLDQSTSLKRHTSKYLCKNCNRVLDVIHDGDVLNSAVCHECQMIAPSVNGVLVFGTGETIYNVRKKVEGNDHWFVNDQIEAYNTGPYRMVLEERRSYCISVFESMDFVFNNVHPEILDFGCGDGQNIDWLRRFTSYDKLYAVDYNIERLSKAISFCRKLGIFDKFSIDAFAMANVFDEIYVPESFDIIFCNHVLEHLNSANFFRTVRNMFSILRNNGYLIVGCPNEGSEWWQMAYNLKPEIRLHSDHHLFFTGDELSGILSIEGFEVEDVHYLGYGFPDFDGDRAMNSYLADKELKNTYDYIQMIGKTFFKKQASSFYIIARKKGASS